MANRHIFLLLFRGFMTAAKKQACIQKHPAAKNYAANNLGVDLKELNVNN